MVIVGGAIANKAGNAGEAWVRLSWAEGFAELGFDVLLLEQLESGAPLGARQWFAHVMGAFGWSNRSALLLPGGGTDGLGLDAVEAAVASASMLVNISGHLAPSGLVAGVPLKVFVDIDPGFTQLWAATGVRATRLDGHDVYLTIGENIPSGVTWLPSLGLEWWPTRQPVVLNQWAAQDLVPIDRLTTVGNWRGPYGSIHYEGRSLGLKVHEFRKFLTLPGRVRRELGAATPTFELAVAFHDADGRDRDRLIDLGWLVTDPAELVATPAAFADYVRSSPAEFSVAQGVYVESGCGWFSDRSVRYLASARPVIVQETGFSKAIPTGLGVLPFESLDDAAAAVCDLVERYPLHCAAARQLAEEHFDARSILGALCDRVGVSP